MLRLWTTRLFIAMAVGWILGSLTYLVLNIAGVL